ncbi:MAG: gene transfer agent family protein [Pseudomonadota bacterium]
MVNPQRGEVAVSVGGAAKTMRLTLGALAALEARLEAGGLVALAERFESGRFGADDLIALLTAGLRGAGEEIDEAEVAEMPFDGGAVAAAEAAATLLAISFRGAA